MPLKVLCTRSAIQDVTNMRRYLELFPPREYCCMTLCGSYNTLLTLVWHLNDPKARALYHRLPDH